MHFKNISAGCRRSMNAGHAADPRSTGIRPRTVAIIKRQALSVLALFMISASLFGCSSNDPHASLARGLSGSVAAVPSAHHTHPGPYASVAKKDASGDTVGVIHYTGVINGTVRFHSSDCTVVEDSVLGGSPFKGMDAPDERRAASSHAPKLTVTPNGDGGWYITFDAPSAQGNVKITSFSQVVKNGVKAKKIKNRWKVILNHAKMGDFEFMDTNSSSMPKSRYIEVTGEITCQRIE